MGLKCDCGSYGTACEYVQSEYPDGCPCGKVCGVKGKGDAPADAERRSCKAHRAAVVSYYGDVCPLCDVGEITPKMVSDPGVLASVREAVFSTGGEDATDSETVD